MQDLIAKDKALAWLRANSGVEQDRPYLGMSQIGRCPRLQYHWFVDGKGAPTDAAHIHCYSGNAWQAMVARILVGAGLAKGRGRELVARFDARYRGHTDDETTDGDLIEIKSMSAEDFREFVHTERLPDAYYDQVQTYLRYGAYRRALVVAVSRDAFDLFFLTVRPDNRRQDKLDARARQILAAIDQRRPPHCTCGRCR